MDNLGVSKVCHERMADWVEELVEANCTPVLLVGVGHGKQRGQVHIFTPDAVPEKALVMVLSLASLELKRRGLSEKVSQILSEVAAEQGEAAGG